MVSVAISTTGTCAWLRTEMLEKAEHPLQKIVPVSIATNLCETTAVIGLELFQTAFSCSAAGAIIV